MAGTMGSSGRLARSLSAPIPTTNQSAVSPRIDESHACKCHLWWLYDDVVTDIYYTILVWLSPGWDQKSNYADYLCSRGIDIGKLNKTQIGQMKTKRPRETWDVTLMLCLIKLSGSLADKNDSKWFAKTGTNPERSLTLLKDSRNALAHTRKIDRKECIALMRRVRRLTRKIQTGLKWVRRHSAMAPFVSVKKSEIDNKFRCFLCKIEGIRDANPSKEMFDRYTKQLHALKMKVIEERLPQLETHLKKFTAFSPVTQLVEPFSDCPVNVQDVFTEMVIEGRGNQKIELENLLEHLPHDDPDRILLIKGHAGIGKSTIVRKLISDWLNKTGVIKGLDSFNMVFHVECRQHIDSFRELLVNSLGNVDEYLETEDLKTATLAFKCLIILDGYDEMNSRSSKLVQEVLTLKKSRNLSLIFTSRPEAEEKFTNEIRPDFKTITKIRLEGIPEENLEDFVKKYHSCISSIQSTQPISGLMKYLEKTKHKMSETWKSPYNLSILVILWSLGQNVNSITTEAELHMDIFNLQKSKLEERLLKDESIKGLNLHLSMLCQNLETYYWHLSRHALTGLKNDDIILSKPTYKELARVSTNLDLPAEQVLGAFLKEVNTTSEKHYCFPHKATQEFFGAYHILLQVTGQNCDPIGRQDLVEREDTEGRKCQATERSFTSILAKSLSECLPCLKSATNIDDAIRVTYIPDDPVKETNKSGPLRGIFKEFHPDQDSVPEKYQNLLCNIISISQVTDISVSDGLLTEALDLLQESGLKDKDDWIRILTNIKCNNAVANWIANKYRLLKGDIGIKDFSFDAYLSVLKALTEPIGRKDNVVISLQLSELPPAIDELATAIIAHGIGIGHLEFRELYRGITELQGDSQENGLHLLLQNNCKRYEGTWSTKFQINSNMKELRVRLRDNSTWNCFFDSLTPATEVSNLYISFGADIRRPVRKIPLRIQSIYVFITDIKTEEEVANAYDILRGFDRSFYAIAFPRCHLSEENMIKLLISLCRITVFGFIAFPENPRPLDKRKEDEIARVKALTRCRYGILWLNDDDIW